MTKKGYNWKARSIKEVEVDESATKQIHIDINHRIDNYDACNALVLPNEKRKTKEKKKNVTVTRLLSKKRRKQLEKVVERKQKKLERAKLLENLEKVQVTKDELKQYVSLQALQTRGLKRHFHETEFPSTIRANKTETEEGAGEPVVNAIKASKRKRYSILQNDEKNETICDPNIVGFEDSHDSDSESDNNDDDNDNGNDDDGGRTENSFEEEKESTELEFKAVAEERQEKSKLDKNNTVSKDIESITASPTKDTLIADKEQSNGSTVDKSGHNKKRCPAVFVNVNRKPDIQAARMKLPVVAEEQVIVETINDNPVVIITGETGSGKTTQVPQFLYEAGYAREKVIGITEPRRVAAISMSKRVAEEMNLTEKEVSYLIRFEGNVTADTKIKFMTDGVLLKEIQNDFSLKKYSVIILDEAHERSVHTDILIGLLSRIVKSRNKEGKKGEKDPLKLIIMSATLRIDELVENRKLFKTKPPVISVESRQFPVTVHFNRRTSENYVLDALRKAAKIHTQLPEGGILIFLTGQQEVNLMVRKLRKAFPLKHKQKLRNVSKKDNSNDENKTQKTVEDTNNSESEDDFSIIKAIRRNKERHKKQRELPTINLDNYSIAPVDDTHEDLIKDENEEDCIDEDNDTEDEDIYDLIGMSNAEPLWVLPLYSLLPSHKQARVFEKPPEGTRLCIVSTNIAETSLTIPNIKYVIDCGRSKVKMYDKVTGVSTYQICYISKAAANQRAGRSGRVGPGHCYRLYSSAVFNDQFEAYAESEIKRKPIDDLFLQMKVMGIGKVENFPFPTSPDIEQLESAERRLIILGALQSPTSHDRNKYIGKVTSSVTPLGHSIAAFPVAPRYGKMLALSHQHGLLAYTVCMVAALSVQQVLLEAHSMESTIKKKWLEIRRSWVGFGNTLLLGDPMVLIKAVGAAEYAKFKGKLTEFCEENGLRYKAIIEIGKLRRQLSNEINLNVSEVNLAVDPKMPSLTDTHAKLLRQIILAGTVDHVARKVSLDEVKEDQDKTKWKRAYKTLEMEDPVYMHSTCVLRKSNPEWVVYQEVYEVNGKMYMRGITAIEPEWLHKFAPTLCRLSKPLNDPSPRYDINTGKVLCHVTGTFGRGGWELPLIEMEYPMNTDGETVYTWFACFLLQGEVCPKLKHYVPSLLSTPASITKSWTRSLTRTKTIISALKSRKITCKEKLLEAWDSNKNFLLSEYQKWLPQSAHAEVALLWPPV